MLDVQISNIEAIYLLAFPCIIQFTLQLLKLKAIHIFEKCVGGCVSLKGDAELCEKNIS